MVRSYLVAGFVGLCLVPASALTAGRQIAVPTASMAVSRARRSDSGEAASSRARPRRKLEADPHNPRHIHTVHGNGYSLTLTQSR